MNVGLPLSPCCFERMVRVHSEATADMLFSCPCGKQYKVDYFLALEQAIMERQEYAVPATGQQRIPSLRLIQ